MTVEREAAGQTARLRERALPWLLMLAFALYFGWKLKGSHFDWAGLWTSVRAADVRLIALAILVIYSNNLFRAMRWAVFLRPALRAAGMPRVPWWRLAGSQFIGFAGLAIFGRIAELIRPLLVARATGLSFPSQVAVVTVERVFDLAAFALLFSLNLMLSPGLQGLPYLHRAGLSIAALTLALCCFVAAIRLAGGTLAAAAGRLVGRMSEGAGTQVRQKILTFRDGLNVIDTPGDFARAAALSVVLWLTIAASYVLVLRAFPAPVHGLGVGHTVVMMGFSVAGSALPIPGGSGAWAGNSFAMTELFHLPREIAVSAGLMVWLVTTMSVIPAGLIFAQIQGVSLRSVARRSEAEEELIGR